MSSLTVSRPACNAGAAGASGAPRRPAAQSGRKAVAEGRSLGIYAKYRCKVEKVDPETGEITGNDPMATRVQRFILQAAARSLFPKSRLDKCLRLQERYVCASVLGTSASAYYVSYSPETAWP